MFTHKWHRIICCLTIGFLCTVALPRAAGVHAATPEAEFSNGEGQDRTLERIAMRLYKSALRSYENEEFWRASRDLIIILDFYPTFSAIDGVLFYLGESLYRMEMYRSGDKIFRYLISRYPASEYVPQALFGLQKIHYNTQNYDESLKFYTGITTRFREREVLDGAYYYGAMAFFHQKQYDDAIRAFKKIRSRSDYFDYGLYTIGLTFLKKKISRNQLKLFAS